LTSTTSSPTSSALLITSLNLSSIIPENRTIEFSFKIYLISSSNFTKTSAKILHTTISNFLFSITSSKFPFKSFTSFKEILFKIKFSLATSIENSSISVPYTSLAPKNFPAIISIPEPVPISITDLLEKSCSSINFNSSEVVGCEPVPKALPGSSSITSSLSCFSYSLHVGFTTNFSLTFSTNKYFFQLFW